MSDLKPRVVTFVWATVFLAVAAEGLAFVSSSHLPGGRNIAIAVFLTLLIALARRFPVHLAPKTKILVDTAPAFTAALVLPPAVAGAVAGMGMLIGEILTREERVQGLFNTAHSVIAGVVASSVYHAVLPASPDSAGFLTLGSAMVAALSMYAVNMALVDSIISLHLGENPFSEWWQNHKDDLSHEGSLYLLGLLPALALDKYPWVVVLVALPAVVVHRSLRDGVQLRLQTRETVEALADIIDLRDRYTHQHSQRVANLSRRLARELGIGGQELDNIFLAARVHDVGKIGIKGSVLMKAGPLSEEEWKEMKSHPEVGATLTSRLPDFRAGRELILHHHERFDGRGYPAGLKGFDIPFGARIISVADTFDALTSTRPYREGTTAEKALAEIQRSAGTQLDPAIVAALVKVLEEEPIEAPVPFEPEAAAGGILAAGAA